MTTPAGTHAQDPARRMVGESFRDYADRIYGMYRALVTDMERLREIERCARVAVTCPSPDALDQLERAVG